MSELKSNKKIIITTLIMAIIMALSSIVIYSNVSAPKFYDQFLNTGIKYLNEGKYDEAILAFNKAIEIEEKSTKARVYLAQGYIGVGEIDKAVDTLKEAQNIDVANERLLMDILEILNQIDPDIAYEFLHKYINAVGKENISDKINEILNTVNELPSVPVTDPEPGTYIKPISVTLKQDKIKVGHSYYYTIDGSEPTKDSNKYRGKIDVSESTVIKLIGFNKNGESTQIITLDYTIDTNIVSEIEDLITESEDLAKNTQVGTEIGNTTEKAKESFEISISKVKQLLNKQSLSYSEASEMKEEIKNALETFKDDIIKPTDKSKLQSAIDKAQNLYDNSTEGSSDGQYKVGSKKVLQNEINKAIKINNNKIAKQEEIDNIVGLLQNAINTFKNSKVSSFTKEKALKYVIDKYGPQFRDESYFEYVENNGRIIDPEGYYYGNELASNEYKFISNQLIENGLRYYIIEHRSTTYNTMYYDTSEVKVYEDGTIYSTPLWH